MIFFFAPPAFLTISRALASYMSAPTKFANPYNLSAACMLRTLLNCVYMICGCHCWWIACFSWLVVVSAVLHMSIADVSVKFFSRSRRALTPLSVMPITRRSHTSSSCSVPKLQEMLVSSVYSQTDLWSHHCPVPHCWTCNVQILCSFAAGNTHQVYPALSSADNDKCLRMFEQSRPMTDINMASFLTSSRQSMATI